jgi:ribosome-associated heat shock protein Hsp15
VTSEPLLRLRVDKWLWAARFFKTRSLAAAAVEGGRVHVNDQRVRPAKEIRLGDKLDITIGELRWTIVVCALTLQRGPAPQARHLYDEADESRAAREAQLAQRRLQGTSALTHHGRPTKRDRRQIDRLRNAD